MPDEKWAVGVDTSQASVARMYDYYLGGRHNFASDVAAAALVVAANPTVPQNCRANRAFLGRAVRYLTDAGIRQFLDIGAGIPTAGNVHEIAQQAAPDSRVLYVDNDPVAVMHGEQLLTGNDLAEAVLGDLRQPEALLDEIRGAELSTIIDLSQPTALLLVSVLSFVEDDDIAYDAVARLRDALPAGSYLVISHAAPMGWDTVGTNVGLQVYRDRAAQSVALRGPDEIMPFFAGFELVDPGLVWTTQWRPDTEPVAEPHRSGLLAGVARRP